MSSSTIERIVRSLTRQEVIPYAEPTSEDWQRMEARFGCHFDSDFMEFISLMSRYHFPGEILNVGPNNTNGNDTIDVAYDLELAGGLWNPYMIPFYAIGNGDYFCVCSMECPNSPVYYYYADRDHYELYSATFADWVKQLPDFLA